MQLTDEQREALLLLATKDTDLALPPPELMQQLIELGLVQQHPSGHHVHLTELGEQAYAALTTESA